MITVTGPKILFKIPILGGIPITQTVISSWVVMILVMVVAWFLSRNITKRPSRTQVIVEKLVTMLYDMVEQTMGKHNLKFAPYIGTLFISSILGTLIGMTQVFRSTTADLSTTAAWAIATTGLVWYSTIKNDGFFKWLKGFTEPIFVMTPMNIISEVANPVSMAFRHFGNIAGGSVLTALIYAALAGLSSVVIGWIPNEVISSIPIFQLGIPAFLSLYFDLFSGFVQALVFCMLTMVFVGGANPAPEDK